MGHKLEIRDGKASFIAFGEKAWHGLGDYVDKRMTAEEAIKGSRLDFPVELQPVRVDIPGGKRIPNQFATVRTDTKQPLGIVGNDYKVIQNTDMFSFFDSIIERGEAIYETAGVLGVGEEVFITAKLPDDILVKGDKIDKYILLTSAHNGKRPLIAGFTPIRVVCNNTLTAALRDLANKVTIRHTTNYKANIEEAARVMGLASTYMNEVGKVFNKMAKVKITDEKLKAYIMEVYKPREDQMTKLQWEESFGTRSTNIVDEMIDFALKNDTQRTDATKRTLFGAYNSISGYYNYTKEYKAATDRMSDVVFGGINEKVGRAFKLAVAML